MYCIKCNNNLAECVCPDLKERLQQLEGAKVLFGPDYHHRIQKQAEKNATEKTVQE